MAALVMEDVRREVDALRREMQSEISSLKAELEAVRARQAAATMDVGEETLAVMAAVVTAYLGKKVRIRSARQTQASSDFSAWAQHGRSINHESHHLPHAR